MKTFLTGMIIIMSWALPCVRAAEVPAASAPAASASAWTSSLPRSGQGVYGRAALRGVVAPGVSVYAWPASGAADSGTAAGVPAVTAQDGTYRLALPPGVYALVAKTGKAGEKPRPGDSFCYYSGSPVTVREKEWTPVGFNLVKVPPEERVRGERSALEGLITFQDKPLEKLYLYLYRDSADAFRGPGIATYPVGAGGRFKVGVPPGRYYLIARKRAKGGMYGPVEIGDWFNYYPGNPVTIGEKEIVRVDLETVARLSQLEDEGERRVPRVGGRIVDARGKPVSGVRVFAYALGGKNPEEAGKGRPLAFSSPSDGTGAFSLDLPRDGLYILIAREKFGGPAQSGEWHGRYGGGGGEGEGVKVAGDGMAALTITVEKEP